MQLRIKNASRLLLAVLSTSLAGSRGLAQSTCRAADEHSARVAQDLGRTVAGLDADRVQQRVMMHLPGGEGIEIKTVTHEAVCRAALSAYEKASRGHDSKTGEPTPTPHQLYILQVDTVYVAWAPERGAGEFVPLVTLDRKYHVLAYVLH